MQNSLIFFLIFSLSVSSIAQDSDITNSNSLKVLPIAFYTPETSLGFGFAGLYTRYFDTLSRPSTFNFGGAYTLENQILAYIPFSVFYKANSRYVFGEIGYYKYFYQFYGVGYVQNDAIQLDSIEIYNVQFPRIRLSYLYQVPESKWYFGGRIWFDSYKVDTSAYKSGGLLQSFRPEGYSGGNVFSTGLIAIHESRNSVLYPSEGVYAEVSTMLNSGLFSPFKFGRISTEVATYIASKKQIDNASATILALQASFNWVIGDAPFYELATLGGTKRMRGYYEGRYRDAQVALFQTEIRQKIYKRFGLVAFASLGSAFSNFKVQDSPLRYAYGAGARFRLSKEGANIRLDYGLGKESSGFYITIGEAF